MTDVVEIKVPFPYSGEGAPCTIHDLKSRSCRWPLAPFHSHPPYMYCGKKTVAAGCAYCAEHTRKSEGR